MKACDVGFCFKGEILKVILLWIQLPSLPLSCWGDDSLSRIGSEIGTHIFVDECTSTHASIAYARMIMEVDMARPLVYVVKVESPYDFFWLIKS